MSCTIVSQVRSRKQVISKILNDNISRDFFTTFTSSPHWPFRVDHEHAGSCRLLILDSSFNPPTNAHAKLLQTSIDSFPSHFFDGSLLLFSTNNVDKTLTGANVLQRAQMMEILAHQHASHNAAVGFTSQGRFVDKAAHIQAWFKVAHQQKQLDLYFILGYDTVVRLLDPKYYPGVSVKEALGPFFKTCHLICSDRGASRDAEDQQEAFWNQVEKEYSTESIKRIKLDPITGEFSSTLARVSICDKDQVGINKILDPSIVEFIQGEENQIYNH